jgi:hypothetical protein
MAENRIAGLLNSSSQRPFTQSAGTVQAANAAPAAAPESHGKTGKELGVVLHKLLVAGKKDLPAAAAQYQDARNNVARAGDAGSAPFVRPEQFGGPHGAYGAWESLRAELEAILNETYKSLDLVGDALCLCAAEYAKADNAAKDELDRLQREEIGH